MNPIIILILFVLISSVLLSLGIGMGYLLRWIRPSLDPSIAILIGVLVSTVSLYLSFRVDAVVQRWAKETEEEEEDDDDDDAKELPQFIHVIPPTPVRTKRRRRRSPRHRQESE
jgi:hypothetical protein